MIRRHLPVALLAACIASGSAAMESGDHAPGSETAHIREQHLHRLDERLNLPAESLRSNCRYESEIAAAPPRKRVVLTFDDGPEPGQTEKILAMLEKHGIRGTFFLIGEKAIRHPELVARIRAGNQHLIGNHSWTHPNFHDLTPAEQAEEITRTANVLPATETPRLFRYPYGNSSCAGNALLHERAYRIVGWHIDSCDWAFDRNGSVDGKEALVCGVLPQNRADFVGHVVAAVRSHDGGIVLLHEIHPNTLQHLEEIIVRLRDEGYAFDALDTPEFAPMLR